MIALPNNCYCSELKVHPKTWKTTKASLKEEWYIYYRFYDPVFKHEKKYAKGKLVRLKKMNAFKELLDRQQQTQKIMEAELARLQQEGYNPITGLYTAEIMAAPVKASTPFIDALRVVEKRISGSKSTKRDLRSILGFISKAALQLGLAQAPVSSVSRKHIKMLLAQIEANQERESAHRYNKNRTYLMMLYKELIELEAVETNPVREISKKQRLVPIRTVLAGEERKKIDKHLKANHYRFWLFTHIFFHSGARLTEMMQVRGKDVNLQEQTFMVTVKKGKLFKQVLKPIKNASLPYWVEAMKGAKPGDFIFSAGLLPGASAINTDQITKRWKVHVKEKLGIQADFYSLKHLHLDEIAAQLGLEDAAAMASHTSTDITLKHYAVNEKHRQNTRLKNLANAFA
jgi:site-specific recombinase XerC